MNSQLKFLPPKKRCLQHSNSNLLASNLPRSGLKILTLPYCKCASITEPSPQRCPPDHFSA